MELEQVSEPRRIGLTLVCLLVAGALWLPMAGWLHTPADHELPQGSGVSPMARALAEHHLQLWSDPALRQRELARMRGSNAEWDLMARTFLVLALGNMALRESGQAARYVSVIDRVIDDTLAVEAERGLFHFLMDYARHRPFVGSPPRSLFIDGEVALMLGTRLAIGGKPEYRRLLRRRLAIVRERMNRVPRLCAESYPDECWLFCNAVAAAALRVGDAALGTDHGAFLKGWMKRVKGRLVDERTKLLISRFDLQGKMMEGPEGSSIWMVAHCLQLVDEAFARQQYRGARRELARHVFGLSYAREWPPADRGRRDIDSGVVLPVLGASPGASGLALVGAAAFHDKVYLKRLVASLNFAGFPVRGDTTLRYAASNQVGDAVMLYAMVLGPLWKHVRRRTARISGRAVYP